ncbi:MAG: thioredoxin domain-containing protein [Candidatus Aminicenantes bacterium]|nr:MAG: thioredoxin domain-containing protein [Candidatus Aminicenantes bacterium]
MDEKSLTLRGVNRYSILHLVTSLLVILSAYLSLRHYFIANFPTSIFEGSFCDISLFFNCDSSAYSFIAQIFGVPLGYFGIAVGIASLMGILFPSQAFERTNKFLNFFNVLGIIGLIFISIFILGSICFFCVAYYIFSFLNFFLFYRYGIDSKKGFIKQHIQPNIRHLVGIGLLTLMGAVGMYAYHQAKIEAQGGGVANKIVQQYFSLPKIKKPSIISPYYTIQATKDFGSAPIRVVEYADFQCSDCLKLRNDLEDLKEDFGDEMNVVFQFFPLDGKCNNVVAKDKHPQSCALSYIAAHDPSKFLAIHDEIFDNMLKTRSDEWVESLAKKYGVEEALTDERTKKIVHDIINTGKEYKPTSDRYKYGIRSTPTMILNERMVIGTLPKVQLRAIFNAILKKEKKGKDESPRFIEDWR